MKGFRKPVGVSHFLSERRGPFGVAAPTRLTDTMFPAESTDVTLDGLGRLHQTKRGYRERGIERATDPAAGSVPPTPIYPAISRTHEPNPSPPAPTRRRLCSHW